MLHAGDILRLPWEGWKVSIAMIISILVAVAAGVMGILVLANILVVLASITHRRRRAMEFLSHFSRAVMMLRLSDSINPSRPYRRD